MAKQKQILVASSNASKTWNLEKGVKGTPTYTHLDFTLRTDIKREMQDFLELLERAVEEVRAELKKN